MPHTLQLFGSLCEEGVGCRTGHVALPRVQDPQAGRVQTVQGLQAAQPLIPP